MSDRTNLQKSYIIVDIFFKVGTPVALAALFFLKSQFVTKAEYDAANFKDGKRLQDIEITLRVMAEQYYTNERQDAKITDHEQRLRVLEQRKQNP